MFLLASLLARGLWGVSSQPSCQAGIFECSVVLCISRDPALLGVPAGRECAYLHFPSSACLFATQIPNIVNLPRSASLRSHLERSVMPLSILQSLYTSKQTNRDPNTPQQAYCQRISSHAGPARRIQIRIA